MRLPSSSIVRILKSIPIVVMKDGVHASSQNRSRRHDLPTPVNMTRCHMNEPRDGFEIPESPMSRSCAWP